VAKELRLLAALLAASNPQNAHLDIANFLFDAVIPGAKHLISGEPLNSDYMFNGHHRVAASMVV